MAPEKARQLYAGLSPEFRQRLHPTGPRPQPFAEVMAHKNGALALGNMVLKQQIRVLAEALTRIANEGDERSVRIAREALAQVWGDSPSLPEHPTGRKG